MPTSPAAPSTSTSRRFAGFGQAQPPRLAPRCSSSPPSAAATRSDPEQATIRSTSSCGSPPLADEPAWESRWGPGRPGGTSSAPPWRVRELGETIDLHGGGFDLIFPHHECEPAQSETATGRPFVRHWMHVGMVRLDGEKMSKSLGNLVFVDDLLEGARAGGHSPRRSRPPLPQVLGLERRAARRGRRRGSSAGARAGARRAAGLDEVRARLDDDLDTPGALAVLDEAAVGGRRGSPGAALLGVELLPG